MVFKMVLSQVVIKEEERILRSLSGVAVSRNCYKWEDLGIISSLSKDLEARRRQVTAKILKSAVSLKWLWFFDMKVSRIYIEECKVRI
jgi:hypothetical protein